MANSSTTPYTESSELSRLETAALASVFDSPTKLVLGGCALFAVFAPIALEVAALAAAACLYAAVKRAMRNGANAAYIRDTGNFAFVLKEPELIRLCNLQGLDKTTRQIQQALQAGQFLSSAACELLEQQGLSSTPPSLADLPQWADRQPSPEPALSSAQAESPVEPPAAESRQPSQGQLPRQSPEPASSPEPELYNLAEDMGQSPQSCLIIGCPGAGKGILISNAVRALKARHSHIWIFGVDPKNDSKEDGYWAEGFDAVKRRSFDSSDYESAIYWLMACIEEFKRHSGPKLLVIDELTLIGQYLDLMPSKESLKLFKAFIAHLASTGDSYEHLVWLAGQIANAEDLKFSGGFRAILRAIALISPKNQAAINALLSTQFVSRPSGGKAEIERLLAISPVSRACFDGKGDRWYPLPALPNHSGFNRDTRQYIRSESGSDSRSGPELRSEGAEPLNAAQRNPFSISAQGAERSGSPPEPMNGATSEPPTYTHKRFSSEQITDLIDWLRDNGQTQQQIIEGLWKVKKGGSDAWKKAREEYRQITGE